jgi:hypothetical protein
MDYLLKAWMVVGGKLSFRRCEGGWLFAKKNPPAAKGQPAGAIHFSVCLTQAAGEVLWLLVSLSRSFAIDTRLFELESLASGPIRGRV